MGEQAGNLPFYISFHRLQREYEDDDTDGAQRDREIDPETPLHSHELLIRECYLKKLIRSKTYPPRHLFRQGATNGGSDSITKSDSTSDDTLVLTPERHEPLPSSRVELTVNDVPITETDDVGYDDLRHALDTTTACTSKTAKDDQLDCRPRETREQAPDHVHPHCQAKRCFATKYIAETTVKRLKARRREHIRGRYP